VVSAKVIQYASDKATDFKSRHLIKLQAPHFQIAVTHRSKGAAVTDCNTDNLQHDCAYIVDALTALVLAEN